MVAEGAGSPVLKRSLEVKILALQAELTTIELWDANMRRKFPRDLEDKVAYECRQARRHEIKRDILMLQAQLDETIRNR